MASADRFVFLARLSRGLNNRPLSEPLLLRKGRGLAGAFPSGLRAAGGRGPPSTGNQPIAGGGTQ